MDYIPYRGNSLKVRNRYGHPLSTYDEFSAELSHLATLTFDLLMVKSCCVSRCLWPVPPLTLHIRSWVVTATIWRPCFYQLRSLRIIYVVSYLRWPVNRGQAVTYFKFLSVICIFNIQLLAGQIST